MPCKECNVSQSLSVSLMCLQVPVCWGQSGQSMRLEMTLETLLY